MESRKFRLRQHVRSVAQFSRKIRQITWIFARATMRDCRSEKSTTISRILFGHKVIMQNVVALRCAPTKSALIWWHCRVLGLGRKLKAYLARSFLLLFHILSLGVVASHCLLPELLSTTVYTLPTSLQIVIV